MGVLLALGCRGERGRRGRERDDILFRIYVLLCPANGKLSVHMAVSFLSRSSRVLLINSANPQIFFQPHDYLLSMLNDVNNKDSSEHNL